MVAADQGMAHIADFLVEEGAIVDMWNQEGKTALMIACERGYVPVVHCLVERKADIALQNKKVSEKVIVLAATCNSYRTLINRSLYVVRM